MKELIKKFRAACDEVDWASMPSGFRYFPAGTCGDISDILAEYLYGHGFQNITYVYGKNGECMHAWLEIGEEAIDVTADQFEGISSPVLIQAPDLWHHKLEGIARRKAGYKNCTDSAVKDLKDVHKEIERQ